MNPHTSSSPNTFHSISFDSPLLPKPHFPSKSSPFRNQSHHQSSSYSPSSNKISIKDFDQKIVEQEYGVESIQFPYQTLFKQKFLRYYHMQEQIFHQMLANFKQLQTQFMSNLNSQKELLSQLPQTNVQKHGEINLKRQFSAKNDQTIQFPKYIKVLTMRDVKEESIPVNKITQNLAHQQKRSQLYKKQLENNTDVKIKAQNQAKTLKKDFYTPPPHRNILDFKVSEPQVDHQQDLLDFSFENKNKILAKNKSIARNERIATNKSIAKGYQDLFLDYVPSSNLDYVPSSNLDYSSSDSFMNRLDCSLGKKQKDLFCIRFKEEDEKQMLKPMQIDSIGYKLNEKNNSNNPEVNSIQINQLFEKGVPSNQNKRQEKLIFDDESLISLTFSKNSSDEKASKYEDKFIKIRPQYNTDQEIVLYDDGSIFIATAQKGSLQQLQNQSKNQSTQQQSSKQNRREKYCFDYSIFKNKSLSPKDAFNFDEKLQFRSNLKYKYKKNVPNNMKSCQKVNLQQKNNKIHENKLQKKERVELRQLLDSFGEKYEEYQNRMQTK